MKTEGAAIVLSLLLAGGVIAGAHAQTQTPADIQAQIQRLQRDIRDLQLSVFKGAPPPAAAPQVEQPLVVPDPLNQRVDDIENGLHGLTGQFEELNHKLDLVTQQADRLQKELDFQAKQQADAQAAAAAAAAKAAADTQAQAAEPSQALAPASGTLGTLPRGTPVPVPNPATAPPSADAKAEYDAAMTLLARAQYDRASDALRNFADSHDGTDLAAQALYWTGDIAYSTQKDFAGAARDFAELLKKYPNTSHAPESMLRLGLSLIALGQQKEGCSALVALPAKYPKASAAILTRAKAEGKNARCG